MQLSERLQGWVGRKERTPVVIDAVVHRADGSTVPVKLTDFSDQGCRMEGEETFAIGEQLEIALPGMSRVKAQVRWAVAGSAGTRFLTEGEF